MPRLNTPVASRPAPVDRNPISVISTFDARLSENDGNVTQWTYTVPSDRNAAVSTITMALLSEIASTTGNTTENVRIGIFLTPTGGSSSQVMRLMQNSAAVVAGEGKEIAIGQGSFMESGDAISAISAYDGDAAGAGRNLTNANFWAMEFDA